MSIVIATYWVLGTVDIRYRLQVLRKRVKLCFAMQVNTTKLVVKAEPVSTSCVFEVAGVSQHTIVSPRRDTLVLDWKANQALEGIMRTTDMKA